MRTEDAEGEAVIGDTLLRRRRSVTPTILRTRGRVIDDRRYVDELAAELRPAP